VNLVDLGVVAGTALGSAVLGSVAGTGGTAVLLPVLVQYFGIQAAVPMVTVANCAANLSRAWIYLGAFLLVVVVWRRLRAVPPKAYAPAWFLPLGVGFGFLNGLFSSVGPLMAPFFLAYGLVKDSYIGTDALITVVMQGTKLAVFGGTQFLTATVLLYGTLLMPVMFLGALVGKLLLDRLPPWVFILVIELTLIVAGLSFLVRG
jgi:uncharacterized membrane protein YfcA